MDNKKNSKKIPPPVPPKKHKLQSSSRLCKSSNNLASESCYSPVHKKQISTKINSPQIIKHAVSQNSLETIPDIEVPYEQLVNCNDLTRLPLLYDSTGKLLINPFYLNFFEKQTILNN